jgi:AraC-like DNA-binding protein
MKINFETISRDEDSSFRLLVNPRLNDLFYWHYHPEYELVYIHGADGTRHVGDHISKYEKRDLVLIGSNIPHLNFDYGVKTSYEKVVIHIQPQFIEKVVVDVPELSEVQKLFQRSAYGIAFGYEIMDLLHERLKAFHLLHRFDQFIELLRIFQILAVYESSELLHENPVKNEFSHRDQERAAVLRAFIASNYHRKIEIAEVSAICNLSEGAFCRYFKKANGHTFVSFLNQYRISHAKRLLLTDRNVTESCFESGFDNLPYFNRIFNKFTGENPLAFKKRHKHVVSAYKCKSFEKGHSLHDE